MASGAESSDVQDSEAKRMADFQRALNATKGYKTAFNVKLNTAIDSLASYGRAPGVSTKNYAERDFIKAEDYLDTLQESYLIAISLAGSTQAEEDHRTTCETKLREARDAVGKLRKDLRKAIASQQTPTAGGAGGGGTATVTAQQLAAQVYNDALKPATIQLDSNPSEFRIWKETMIAYFEANGFSNQPAEVQNAYVLQCMSPEVRSMIEIQIEKKIEPFAKGTGTVAIMDELYAEIYTVLQKRMNMMTARMKPAETPAAFVARLNKLFLEADIDRMNPDDFRSFILIAGITNQKLRAKLLELKDPSYMDLCRKVTQWMVTNSMEKAMERSSNATGATINQINSNRGRGRGRGGPSRGRGRGGTPNQGDRTVTPGAPPPSIKNTPSSLHDKCIKCGASSHEKNNCTADGATLKCNKCGRSGHMERVCLEEYNKWRFPKTSQPSRVRHVSTSSVDEDEGEEAQ